MQLLVDVRDVGIDRGPGDLQRVGNFLVGKAARQEPEDLPLPRCEDIRFGFVLAGVTERRDYLAGDVAGPGRAAFVNVLDGRKVMSSKIMSSKPPVLGTSWWQKSRIQTGRVPSAPCPCRVSQSSSNREPQTAAKE